MSDRKSRLITICMLVGAVVMIGLALTGTLQMRVSRSPVAYVVTKWSPPAGLLWQRTGEVRVILAGAAAWGARINPHSSGGQPPQLFSEPGEGVKPGAMTAEVAGRPGDRYALLY